MAVSRRHLSSALSHVARSLKSSHVSPASPSPSPSPTSYGLSKPFLFWRQPWLLSHGFQSSFTSPSPSPSPVRPLGDSQQTRQISSTAKTLQKRQKSGSGGETGKGPQPKKGGKSGGGGGGGVVGVGVKVGGGGGGGVVGVGGAVEGRGEGVVGVAGGGKGAIEGGGEGKGSEAVVAEPVDPFKDTLPPKPLPSDFFSNPNSTLIPTDEEEEDMESLLLNRDLSGIPGLPPPKELRAFDQSAEERAERREMERLKQEQIFRSRVRLVDKYGRSYGTGRRKCSVARVWLKEGEGHVAVNNMSYDLYFPEIEWRARLLQPFVVTETLGNFDVKATVTGGGRAGQAGAIRLGISRALQLYTPELRPPLKAAGFLMRDPRVVERKKPGKAKARKSFTWVKR